MPTLINNNIIILSI